MDPNPVLVHEAAKGFGYFIDMQTECGLDLLDRTRSAFEHGEDKHLELQLTVEFFTESFHSVEDCLESKLAVGAVDPLKGFLVPAAQRYFDHLRQGGGCTHFRQVQQGTVGQQRRWNGGIAEKREHAAKFCMQSGFTGSGKGQVIGVTVGVQPVAESISIDVRYRR
jgi:hypothetical protein